MKKNLLPRLWAALVGAVVFIVVQTSAFALGVGDPAPKLTIAKWAQGEPVKEFESSKVYIVEFWATWCGPCVKTIPHLNELHEKFKDKGLIVIGQNLGENEGKIKPFIEKMGATMTYRVAIDDMTSEPRGAMAKNWMTAAGQNGIPCALIVDKKGKIAWIGHPATLKDNLLEDILADRYDPKKAPAANDESAAAAPPKKDAKKAPARPAAVTKNHDLMTEFQKLNGALRAQEWDEAEAALNAMEKLVPENQRARLSLERFQVFAARKDFVGGYKALGQASDAQLKDGWLQNQIAWVLATKPGLENRDLALAERAGLRAVEASGGKDANALDTLARVQFMAGKTQDAVATQQKALDAADAQNRAAFRMSLASYQAGKLPETTN